MKKLVLLASLLASTFAFSQELINFEEVKTAITGGKKIHLTIDMLKCTWNKPPVDVMTFALTPNEFGIVNDMIFIANTHFTLENPAFLNRPIYEFHKYIITPDNQLTLTAQVLDAISFKPLAEKKIIRCDINTGAKIYA